ncbi:MAG: insulinase family protein [Actinobacteria bacterium]|nr:insulinase family protein [Actinomycetota bacterium]
MEAAGAETAAATAADATAASASAGLRASGARAAATTPKRAAATRAAGSEIRRTAYDSGLRVVTETMPAARSVALGFWVAAGSRDEPPAIAGSSHFLEHLLFKGTKERTARDIAEAFDAVGGELNAFSAKEYTCYYARVLDRDLPMAIEYLTDMLSGSVIGREDLDAERQVILEEINMHEDTPDDLIHDVFTEAVWPGHPLGRPVLGTVATIKAATPDRVRRFYRKHYVPGNVVVAAAGNLDHDAVLKLVEAGMDAGKRVPEKRAPDLRPAGKPPVPVPAVHVRTRKTEQAHVMVGTSGLARQDPRRFAFGVANTALGGGMSSRLFQEIREKRGLVYSVYSYHSMYTECGLFSVYAGTSPKRAHEVLGLIRREVEDVAERGISADELERAKGHMKGSMVLSQEDTNGRMSRLGKSEIGHGEILSADEIVERIDAVTSADVESVSRTVLGQPMALAVIGPFKAGEFDGDLARGGAGERGVVKEERTAARRPKQKARA